MYTVYTVILFLARNGRIRAVKFRPKNFGRISFDLGEISPNQQILRLNNGRISPKSAEIRPKFLRANLNCADSPGSPEKISTVYTGCLTERAFCSLIFFSPLGLIANNVNSLYIQFNFNIKALYLQRKKLKFSKFKVNIDYEQIL
jgi:hypothetical protein